MGEIVVKGSHGDLNLGGQDIDDLLVLFLIFDFQMKTGIDLNVKSDQNYKAKAKLKQHAKRAKELLSAENVEATDIIIESLANGEDYEYNLTVAQFE